MGQEKRIIKKECGSSLNKSVYLLVLKGGYYMAQSVGSVGKAQFFQSGK